MAEFLLVVEGLAADGADAALFVSEDTYKAAMFACVFREPVHGYVWCDRHGWVRSDETCVCGDCVQEAMEADLERVCEIEERATLDTERAAEWAVQQHVSQTMLTDERVALAMPSWYTQRQMATALAQLVSQFGEDWPGEGDHGEMAYRRINRADPNYEPVYSREQAARQDVFDMAKGKMPRAFR